MIQGNFWDSQLVQVSETVPHKDVVHHSSNVCFVDFNEKGINLENKTNRKEKNINLFAFKIIGVYF